MEFSINGENVPPSDLDGPDRDKSTHKRNSLSDGNESPRSLLFNPENRSEATKEALQKRREKNEANLRLSNFKKSFTVNNAQTYNDKINLLPEGFKDGDWEEQILYAYFAINYFDENIFNVVVRMAHNFKNFPELRQIMSQNGRAYLNLTDGNRGNITRLRLNQLAFEAALEKDYIDIAFHFIQSSQV